MTDEFCSTNLFNFSNFLSDLGCFDEILESFILFVPTFKKIFEKLKGEHFFGGTANNSWITET